MHFPLPVERMRACLSVSQPLYIVGRNEKTAPKNDDGRCRVGGENALRHSTSSPGPRMSELRAISRTGWRPIASRCSSGWSVCGWTIFTLRAFARSRPSLCVPGQGRTRCDRQARASATAFAPLFRSAWSGLSGTSSPIGGIRAGAARITHHASVTGRCGSLVATRVFLRYTFVAENNSAKKTGKRAQRGRAR